MQFKLFMIKTQVWTHKVNFSIQVLFSTKNFPKRLWQKLRRHIPYANTGAEYILLRAMDT